MTKKNNKKNNLEKKMINEINIDDIIKIKCSCDKFGFNSIKKEKKVKLSKSNIKKSNNKKNILIILSIVLFLIGIIIKNNTIKNEIKSYIIKLSNITTFFYIKTNILNYIKKLNNKINLLHYST